MKADTRGQFKAAAYPWTVVCACGPVLKKAEPTEGFQGSSPGKSGLSDYPPKQFI